MRAAGEKKSPAGEPADHALGRSRGGFSTKLHLVTERHGIPLGAVLTAGQDSEVRTCPRVLAAITIPRARGGRPRRKPRVLVGDKGYNAGWLRLSLKQQRIRAVIPRYSSQALDPTFDRATYRTRNVIERCVGWLKNNRRLATRSEKLAINFMAFVKLAIIQRLFRFLDSPNRT